MGTENNYNTKIISFIGLPGSGKTTITKELQRKLQSKGYEVVCWEKKERGMVKYFLSYNKIQRHILPCLYVFKNWSSLKVFARSIYLFVKLNPWRLSLEDIKRCWNTLKRFLIRNFLMQKQKADVYIFDEAILNFISHINAENINGILEELVDVFIPANTYMVIVLVNTPFDVIVDRIIANPKEAEERGWIGCSKERIRNIYKKMQQNQEKNKERIADIIEKIDNIFTIKIDTTKITEENVKYITDVIMKIRR